MNVQANKKGFTIIEVVLVLAIAGLIFLMVFIALPALQRGQRDQQRRGDLSRAQTAVQNFQTNNRNRIPTVAEFTSTAATGFTARYLTAGGDAFQDPDGQAYTFTQNTANNYVPTTFTAGTIYFTLTGKCNGEAAQTGAGANKVALQYKLEGGGVSCVSN